MYINDIFISLFENIGEKINFYINVFLSVIKIFF